MRMLLPPRRVRVGTSSAVPSTVAARDPDHASDNSLKVLVFHFSLGGAQGIDIFASRKKTSIRVEDRPEAGAIAAASARGHPDLPVPSRNEAGNSEVHTH